LPGHFGRNAAQVPYFAEPDNKEQRRKYPQTKTDIPEVHGNPENDIHGKNICGHRNEPQYCGINQPLNESHFGKSREKYQQDDKTRDENEGEETPDYTHNFS
jgi:hypothetical protein